MPALWWNMNTLKKQKYAGFTLIELMIAVVVLAILSGVVMSTINPRGVRNKTEDSSKRSNLEKLYMGIEAFKAAEGSYPTGCTSPCSTLTALGTGISTYISAWPTEPPNATYYYTNSATNFCVYVNLSSDTSLYYSYTSNSGKIITTNGACADIT
jgi:prepilin-type N-terminal cleavage/methylation domain-containing protein